MSPSRDSASFVARIKRLEPGFRSFKNSEKISFWVKISSQTWNQFIQEKSLLDKGKLITVNRLVNYLPTSPYSDWSLSTIACQSLFQSCCWNCAIFCDFDLIWSASFTDIWKVLSISLILSRSRSSSGKLEKWTLISLGLWVVWLKITRKI